MDDELRIGSRAELAHIHSLIVSVAIDALRQHAIQDPIGSVGYWQNEPKQGRNSDQLGENLRTAHAGAG